MEINDLTGEIIGCVIEVHKYLGPGLLESTYEDCLVYEIHKKGFNVEKQKPVPVIYKEIKLECGYRLDLLVENEIIIEIKSVENIAPIHEAQILTYMRLARVNWGLLFNFNVTMLKNGIRRFTLKKAQ